MTDQAHEAAQLGAFLAALLEQPDFREGPLRAYEAFENHVFEEFHERKWTEKELIGFAGERLSAKFYRKDCRMALIYELPVYSYLHHIGFVMGYLDRAYAARADVEENARIGVEPPFQVQVFRTRISGIWYDS
ncbi:MAG: hypothetical protein IMW89_04600 [Ktedonobacteraceae bacterium]|nr:hypothetical protein [Ktedonobacteraceae bacterium]